MGFTCRCVHSVLFGIPALPGGQAQYVRVPKAGGTLFKVDSIVTSLDASSGLRLADTSLLLLADILPTGAFAAVQALQHAKLGPMLSAIPYPFSGYVSDTQVIATLPALLLDDRVLTFAIVGLGPVGVVRCLFYICSVEVLKRQTVCGCKSLGYARRRCGIQKYPVSSSCHRSQSIKTREDGKSGWYRQ